MDPRAGRAAYEFVEKAVRLAMGGEIDAIATAPLNKEALKAGGCSLPGHTEILGHLSGTRDFSMMLVSKELKVIHVSTHVSLRRACDLVKRDRVLRVIELADRALRALGNSSPRIAVAGLNPHAGEGGLFGTEEIEEIVPAIEMARERGIDARGPVPPTPCSSAQPSSTSSASWWSCTMTRGTSPEAGGIRGRRQRDRGAAVRAHLGGPRHRLRHRVDGNRRLPQLEGGDRDGGGDGPAGRKGQEMRKAESVFSLVMTLLCGVYLYFVRRMDVGTFVEPGPGFMPAVVGIMAI